jgi:hypothetical protein
MDAADLCSGGDVLADEQRRAVQCLVGFVQRATGEGLEDVRHVGGDVQDDVHPGRGGARGQTGGVVEEDLVRSREREVYSLWARGLSSLSGSG